MFKTTANIYIIHIPYRGSTPAQFASTIKLELLKCAGAGYRKTEQQGKYALLLRNGPNEGGGSTRPGIAIDYDATP